MENKINSLTHQKQFRGSVEDVLRENQILTIDNLKTIIDLCRGECMRIGIAEQQAHNKKSIKSELATNLK